MSTEARTAGGAGDAGTVGVAETVGTAETVVDAVVVGAGMTGASAAWHLARAEGPRAGRDVVLLEQFELGHSHGSSHGTSRIFRRAYQDPFYVELTGRAQPYWEILEDERKAAGDGSTPLRTFTGALDTGDLRDYIQMRDLLRDAGVPADIMAPDAVAERWPGLRVAGPALYHRDAGHLNLDETVASMVRLARFHGARVRTGVTVERLEPAGEKVRVHTSTGETWLTGTVVLAVGGWLPEHAGELPVPVRMPPLQVKQQEVFHFRQKDPAAVFPTVVHKGTSTARPGTTGQAGRQLAEQAGGQAGEQAGGQFYTLGSGADGGPEPAMKVGQFDSATYTTASARDGLIDPRAREAVVDYLTRHLPGLETNPVAEASCLFTMTADTNFVIDKAGPVVVASPCSGHGAKFAPLLGRLIADVVDGAPSLPRFRFRT